MKDKRKTFILQLYIKTAAENGMALQCNLNQLLSIVQWFFSFPVLDFDWFYWPSNVERSCHCTILYKNVSLATTELLTCDQQSWYCLETILDTVMWLAILSTSMWQSWAMSCEQWSLVALSCDNLGHCHVTNNVGHQQTWHCCVARNRGRFHVTRNLGQCHVNSNLGHGHVTILGIVSWALSCKQQSWALSCDYQSCALM